MKVGFEVLPHVPEEKMRQWCEEILSVISEEKIIEAIPYVKTKNGKMAFKRMLVKRFRK